MKKDFTRKDEKETVFPVSQCFRLRIKISLTEGSMATNRHFNCFLGIKNNLWVKT